MTSVIASTYLKNLKNLNLEDYTFQLRFTPQTAKTYSVEEQAKSMIVKPTVYETTAFLSTLDQVGLGCSSTDHVFAVCGVKRSWKV